MESISIESEVLGAVNMARTSRNSKIASPVPIFPKNSIESVSKLHLVLVKNKSSIHWALSRWNSGFAKEQPWRTEQNNPILGSVIAIYELPEINAESGGTDHSDSIKMVSKTE